MGERERTEIVARSLGGALLDLFPSRDAGRFGRRLKRARGARIPVTIVTGFLGAGKTTLLRRFLATPEGEGTAVIINEFGSVGIDDALVRGSSDEVTLLGNCCLCCNTRSDLQIALRNLLADRLVVSKTDLAGAPLVKRLMKRLRMLNPRAVIHTAIEGDLDPRCLLELDASQDLRLAGHAGFVAEAEHSDGISSFVLTDDAPLHWDAFARSMETLIALRGPDLLRVKGFLNVAGCRGPVVVQVVQHLAHPPVELAAWPDKNRASRLVFITRKIPESQVRGLFGAV